MDIIYLKIKIKKSDSQAENLRNEGLLFSSIANSLDIEREAVIEIDETNYKQIISQIVTTFTKYDKGRSNKESA
jgi:hypothetical protein